MGVKSQAAEFIHAAVSQTSRWELQQSNCNMLKAWMRHQCTREIDRYRQCSGKTKKLADFVFQALKEKEKRQRQQPRLAWHPQ